MAGKYDILIEKGATYSLLITLKDDTNTPIDLTGAEARLHIRNTKSSESTLLFEMTTENGRITIEESTGQIQLYIDHEETSQLSWSRGYYDLELILNDEVTRVIEGVVRVSEECTRE